MPKKVGGLEKLLIEELQDLLDAEKQLVRAIPKIAKSAKDEELETAFRNHLEVTKGQVQRLEQIFRSMDMPVRSRPCKAMKGLVEESMEMISEGHEEGILDSALTGSARKVEHYEMAGYESARAMAQQLGMKEAAQLLQETLNEEIQTDKQLATISKRLLKSAVASRQMQSEEGEQRGRKNDRRQARASGGRAAAKKSSSRGATRASGGRKASSGGASAHALTDHQEIRQWAEDRDARPACVRGTGGGEDTGMIRLDFPGYTGEQSLEEISWDDWFEKFDESNLALLVQDATASGEKSNFNKLVSRETIEKKERTRAAR